VTVSRLERTTNEPTPETVQALARALRYPAEFFYGSDIDEVEPDSASFRSLKAMTARERDAALAAASIAFLVSDWVEQRFQLPTAAIPNLSFERDPTAAARRLRSAWGLGEQPVRNMIDLLEAKGIRVFSLSENSVSVDAFSCWRNEVPYVFLNTYKSSEHSRFDAAHELAHLILHKHGGPRQRDVEAEANAFASEFLMPQEDVSARVIRVHSLAQVKQAKARWGVSLAAMTYRLAKLGILTEWQSRKFFIEISRAGYRTSEPDPMPAESSLVWQTVFRELWKSRMPKESVARALCIPPEELESVIFGLASPAFDPRSVDIDQASFGPKLAVKNGIHS
jgi:Zn-dependent peptidase ImmA (M78 family)